MRMVVKFAGALLEDPAALQSISRQVAELVRQGHEPLGVHGGGEAFTATLARMGTGSRLAAGRRSPARETRSAAGVVLGGLPNNRAAAAIAAAGQPARGNSAR